jgi:hypothetical protein
MRARADHYRLRISPLATALCLFLGGLTTCGPGMDPKQEQENRVTEATIEQVLKQHTDRLMSIPGVVGTAIGECGGKPCIMVLVAKKTPDLMKKLPSTLQGFPVVVEETGAIRPLEERKAK